MKVLLNIFDRAFASIDENSRAIISKMPEELLFQRPDGTTTALFATVGESVLRSAAMVEQTFGGITRRLWDDPFEWTLPEKLSNKPLILEYLDEVAATRMSGMAFFRSDDDLKRELPAPEKLVLIGELLLHTIATAENHLGRAVAIFANVTGLKAPRR